MNYQDMIDKQLEIANSNKNNYKLLLSCYNNIVEIKHQWNKVDNRVSTYCDLKSLFVCYFNLIDEAEYGYDFVNFQHMKEKLNYLQLKEKIRISCFIKRNLETRGYEEELDDVVDFINKLKLKALIEDFKLKNILRLLLNLTSLNLITLLSSLLFFVVVVSTALLPAPLSFMEFYRVELSNYSKLPYLNNMANIFGYLVGAVEGVKIIPLHVPALIILIGVKLFYLLIIVNYFMREIEKYFKRN